MAPLKPMADICICWAGEWLPWLFCHGPIEARPTADEIRESHANFHDYFVMAPLKLSNICLRVPPATHFHDYFVMAPLKPGLLARLSMTGEKLPWLFCHGPIEAIRHRLGLNPLKRLPWLFCHGPIEAVDVSSLAIGGLCDFHDYFVMAPLKRRHAKGSTSIIPHFHDYFVMAPLKLYLCCMAMVRRWHFHDYFVMAPLKQPCS